jgi:Na+/proline symporter/serine/threonine protein kinase
MFSPAAVLLAIIAYGGLLFALAHFTERNAAGRRLASSAAIYSLSFAVYCTTWTYYGSVGNAANNGMLFVAIYTGPTLGFFFGTRVLRRITELKHAHRITSIADFISARYGKSRAVAAIVTVGLMVGIIPYVALQVKAISDTYAMLTQAGGATGASLTQLSAYVVVVVMIVLTVVFGIRRIDPTERHPGMIASLAMESFVKLAVILAVAVFVAYSAFGGLGGFVEALETKVPATMNYMGQATGPQVMTWVTWTLLAMGAYFLLPRQFHVGVVENAKPRHVKTAMWSAPLYLFAINLGVLPIALGGKLLALPNTAPDQYVLALPLAGGHAALSLCVFIGGFSAAIGMIMVETTTMATMVSNHLLLPLAEAVPTLGFLRRRLLYVRWVAAAFVIWLGYRFAVSIGKSYMLISIGLLSFAAVFQLAPVVLGGLYWKKASTKGAIIALTTAFLVWFYTLLMPTFVKSGWMDPSILAAGPFGIQSLRPEALFGMTGVPQLVHGTLWTTAFNIGAFVLGSIAFPATREERSEALRFLNPGAAAVVAAGQEEQDEANIDAEEKREKILRVLSRYYSQAEAVALTDRCFHAVGLTGKSFISITAWRALFAEVERTLAGAVGAAGAYQATQLARDEGSIFGKYQLIGSLGRGGMADVFLARSRDPMDFNKLVVVKRLRTIDGSDAGFVDMFLDEARLSARLTHPNIVQTYEVGECDGSYYIAMQFLEGQPLVKLAEHQHASGERLAPAIWVRIVADALSGLHYAHELKDYGGAPLNVVHRDVSPDNVFVTYQGQVKIVDFGIAKATLNTSKTQAGMVKGKAAYMAPEQAASKAIDGRADVFAIGVVLWEGITGTRLFSGDTIQALHKLLACDIPRAGTMVEHLDPTLDDIVAKALAKNPSDRFSSAQEMRDALENYLRMSGQPTHQEDIGKVFTSLFAGARAQLQQRIRRHLAEAEPSADGEVAAIGSTARGAAAYPHVRTGELAMAVNGTARTFVGPKARAPRESNTTALALVAGGVVVMIGFVAQSRKETANGGPANAAQAAATGTVFVMTEPQEAAVSWNGRVLGTTPGMFDLPTGDHTLILTKDGYAMEPVIVSISPPAPGAKPVIASKAVFLHHKEVEVRTEPAVAVAAPPPPAPAPPPAAAPPRSPPVAVASPRRPRPEPADKETLDAGVAKEKSVRDGGAADPWASQWVW